MVPLKCQNDGTPPSPTKKSEERPTESARRTVPPIFCFFRALQAEARCDEASKSSARSLQKNSALKVVETSAVGLAALTLSLPLFADKFSARGDNFAAKVNFFGNAVHGEALKGVVIRAFKVEYATLRSTKRKLFLA
mgnify:CR=1 FL=1